MQDVLQQNAGTITGTPTLVTGALFSDTDQALQFDGSTNSMSVADSASSSLAVPDGGPGGMALECFVRFTAFPGVQKTIIGKSGSYSLDVTAAGKLIWNLANGANNVAVTSLATLSLNTWYHVVGVCNGDYTGTTIFGKQTTGALQASIAGDYLQGSPTGSTSNLQVCQYTINEKGLITSVVMDVQRVFDTPNNEWVAAVVYQDSSGLPGVLLGQSAALQLSANARAWTSFPFTNGPIVYSGPVWLGLVAGSESGQFQIGYDNAGGLRRWVGASVTNSSSFELTGSSPNPFGSSAGNDTANLALYANYTALARTGNEGKALLYLNGALDNSASFTHGVADSANATLFASSLAVQIDDVSIWNRKLTTVDVARHYAAAKA